MNDWKERVREEYRELKAKKDKLDLFLVADRSDEIGRVPLWLLRVQQGIMSAYLEVLSARLDGEV